MQKLSRFAMAIVILALVGCGSGGGASGPAASGKIDFKMARSMSSFYSRYLRTHYDRSPPDEKAFREFLTANQRDLEHAGLTVDEMFVSPRTGQPLVWVYGKTPPMSGDIGQCYAYEKTSSEGKRLVIGDGGKYAPMDDVHFRTLFPNAQ